MNNCFNVNCNQCDDTLVCWFVSSSSLIKVANIVDGFYLQTFDGCRSTIYVDGVPSSSFLETNHYFTGSTSLNSTTNDGTYGGYEIGEECDICNSGSRNVSISNAHVVEYGIKPLENGKHTIISESMAYLSNLVRVYIPSNVSSIKKRGFSSCGNLSGVTIGKGTTSIGSEAFKSCTKLKYIDWGCCGKKLTLGANAFNSCGFENLDISDCITSAGYSCFGNNLYLRSVTIGRGLKMLSDSVFTYCQSLASVTFRETSKVTSIGIRAFYNCRSLTSCTIPNSVTSIGNETFLGCSSLSSVKVLSSTPPNLGTSVFPSSVKIYVPSYSVETYKTATNWSYYADNIYPMS